MKVEIFFLRIHPLQKVGIEDSATFSLIGKASNSASTFQER